MLTNPYISLFRPEILALSAYHVPNAQRLIKLDAMENPYTWTDDIKQQWLELIKDCPLNRYPNPHATELVDIIYQMDNISKEYSILLGNGSDEIIQLLLMALKSGSKVLSTAPAFVMYQQISQCLGLSYESVPLLHSHFELDISVMLAFIKKHNPSITFIAYPNNPTGNLFNEQAIEKIIKTSEGLVIIDEAYSPFAKASFMNRLNDYDNLLVMRTVSKLGLAGLRLGYLVGKKDIIEQLNKIRLPYNINSLTQLTAHFALSHKSFFDAQTDIICSERLRVFDALKNLDNITAYPSAANFILFKTPEKKATAIFESIKQQGVLIKNMSPQGGLLTDCLRVTIGTPDENTAFLNALAVSLKNLT